jgi:hypothetical protein
MTDLLALSGLGQMAFMRFAPRALPGFGQDEEGYATSRIEEGMEPGDYHILGSSIILRAQPDASSAALATLQRGETVRALGEIVTDAAHIVDVKTGAAIPNPDPEQYAGIDYVHVGTQTHGAGWVAIDFIGPGAGTTVTPPATQAQPETAAAPPKKDLVKTFLIGGLIGTVVLGGIVLLAHATKPSRQLAHA